ncbi:polymer-forming cytoskeletal protein [Candidatus Aerophobetes bacterium]|nr:polymer-forming cytoskeletal protein [Candidatus Aerophobetes bacterium]
MFKRKKGKVGEVTNSIIGPGTEFKGTLKDKQSIRVDGKFEGEIQTEASVIIGEHALVQANIKAATVVVAGKLLGDIDCEGKVEICSTGSLEGKVRASDLTIAEGASFNGECRMNPLVKEMGIRETVLEEEE